MTITTDRLNSFCLIDHIDFRATGSYEIPCFIRYFGYIDFLFSISDVIHTVTYVGESRSFTIYSEENEMNWWTVALKATLWILAIITILPAITISIAKALYRYEIIQLIEKEEPSFHYNKN